MKKFVLLFCFVCLVMAVEKSFSQEIDSLEITSSVPALTEFHEIIFPMWHTAYPAKDISALKGFVPQIKASMEAINNAILPGILKDKETAWKRQLNELNVAADNYYKAAEGNDDEALLMAAEKIHYNFEMMNRVIRPVLKEIDAYHQILYVIYHKLYPDKKYDEMATLTDSMVEKADAIVKYPREKLAKRLGDHVAEFDLAATALYTATVAFREALGGNDPMRKDEAVQHVHAMYQQLESVFR